MNQKRETERDHEAYRGYSLTRSPFDGLVRVSKDGFVIFTAEDFKAAKAAVDEVTR